MEVGFRKKTPAWFVDENTIAFKASNRDAIILIDAEDFPLVRPYTWSINARGIPATCVGDRQTVLLYWHVFGRGNKLVRVTHKDGNRLNNRKSNFCAYIAGERTRTCYPSVAAAQSAEENRWTLP